MNIKMHFYKFLTILLLLLSYKLVFAVIPSTINYQGHLTDNANLPIDGMVSMEFAIYDVTSGGTALWNDRFSVSVNQGVFSIELGGGASPFPAGLFETPLWISLSIAADSEMLPRRPVSSTGFSFKAGDANTLEGISASTLDQSGHVTDTANPHNVTAAQAGAADAASLLAHTIDTSNPHSVTAAQTGAIDIGEFASHKADSAAHHLRYTNTEAVSVMGAKSDANALNHDKFTNADAVVAILAADGAGSTLDSDRVDGLEASELIDAAQDEVRIAIGSLPYTINQHGSYYLTGNLNGSRGGISISADDVTLDLMGFTIDGGGAGVTSYGIFLSGGNNVTIRNGTVKGFGWGGIYQGAASVRYTTVMDINALNNGTLGTDTSFSGIYLRSPHSHVERCNAGNNGGYGIHVYTSSKVINSTAYSNSGTYGINAFTSSILSGNTVYNHLGMSYAIFGDSGVELSGNTASNNHGAGGIYGGDGAVLAGNTAQNNDGIGIFGGIGASFIANNAYSNVEWGIFAVDSNLVQDNALYGNNSATSNSKGGLRIGLGSRVTGNFLDSNVQYNIYVLGSNNTIENNHVTDSIYGLYFATTGNFYANNRASGNTTAAFFNTTGQINGGGNYSF